MAELTTFITDDFATVFLTGFAAGFIIMAVIYVIRAVAKLFFKITRGRS